jgi:glycosyltransferase involved in cell wall biosynthesis
VNQINNDMDKQISIAMATYNGESFLRDQLDSLYTQTTLPDEVIVIDDCSDDNTVQILNEYNESKGLKYYINKNNVGINQSFEIAIRKCSGDYVMICDQDDIWLPDKVKTSLQKMVEIERDNLPTLVTSGHIDIDEEGKILSSFSVIKHSENIASALLRNSMQGCTLMLNKNLVSNILPLPREEGVMYDAYIGITALMIGKKYDIMQPLMYYRHHGNNVLAGKHTRSLWGKLNRWCWQYAGFIDHKREKVLLTVLDRHAISFRDEQKNLFYQMLNISAKQNIFLKAYRIMKIPELPGSLRIKIVIRFIVFVAHDRVRGHG